MFGAEVPYPFPIAMATASGIAEIVLPVLLVLGLATRLAALGILAMTAVIQLTVPDICSLATFADFAPAASSSCRDAHALGRRMTKRFMIFPFHFRADPSPALLIAMPCLHDWGKIRLGGLIVLIRS